MVVEVFVKYLMAVTVGVVTTVGGSRSVAVEQKVRVVADVTIADTLIAAIAGRI